MKTFDYDRAQIDQIRAARDFTLCCKSTGRFMRTARGQVAFILNPDAAEHIAIARTGELKAILSDGEPVQIRSPHALDATDFDFLWHSLHDNRWRLPSLASVGIREPAVRS